MAVRYTNKPVKAMLDNFSKSLTYTPVTKTTDNVSSNETLTDGTDVTIKGAFFKKEDGYTYGKFGKLGNADAVILVKTNVTLNVDSKITYSSEVFRIEKVETRYIGPTAFYKVAQLFLIT